MAYRRHDRRSDMELWIAFFARLPWKVCLGLVPVAFVLFNALSRIPPPVPKTVAELGASYLPIVLRTAGMICQWLVPGVLAVAAFTSWLRQRQSQSAPPPTTADRRSRPAPVTITPHAGRLPAGTASVSFARPLATPQCPACQAPMVRRTAARGANAGGAFYGCSTYPQCRGTVAV